MASFDSRPGSNSFSQCQGTIKELSNAYRRLVNNPHFSKFGFFVGILGPGCNACSSKTFTEAECGCRPCKINDQPVECWPVVEMRDLFKKGYDLLRRVTNGNVDELNEKELQALELLCNYIERKGDHEKSLSVLHSIQWTEAHLTTVLGEHLLGKLSPGKYLVDARTRTKQDPECSCGCGNNVTYGITGIGHEDVWHGFIDMLFLSNVDAKENLDDVLYALAKVATNSDTSAKVLSQDEILHRPSTSLSTSDTDLKDSVTEEFNTTPMKRRKTEDETRKEVKVSIKGSSDQAISQVIVSAMLLKMKHPDLDNHLVPNIVISNREFYIVMYDASKDILLCSPICDLFLDKSKSVVYEEVILILWMVLHHRILCSGIPQRQDLSVAQSGFRQRAAGAWDIYMTKLKEFVNDFPRVATRNMECTILQYFDKAKFS